MTTMMSTTLTYSGITTILVITSYSIHYTKLYEDYKKVKTENYTSWHEGYINCESVELHKITTKLERYYDVNIFFGNDETEKKKITGKLKLQSDIDGMLNVLAATRNNFV